MLRRHGAGQLACAMPVSKHRAAMELRPCFETDRSAKGAFTHVFRRAMGAAILLSMRAE
jgi:hypothetical protein